MLTLTIILTVIFLLTGWIVAGCKYIDDLKEHAMIKDVFRLQFTILLMIMFLFAITANQVNDANKIKSQIILMKPLEKYGDDFYKLQQEYSVYANSMFFGWAVRRYSIKENYILVLNQAYIPNQQQTNK